MALTEATQAQININANGNWIYPVSPLEITEAGTDFSGTFTSSANQVLVDITQNNFWANLLLNYSWRVDIRKSDVDWNPSLSLFAQRTGNGTPFWNFLPGTINGGTTYQQLTNINQTFFNGTRTRLDIPIQYQITGVSVLLPAKTYTSTVIYTVTEL